MSGYRIEITSRRQAHAVIAAFVSMSIALVCGLVGFVAASLAVTGLLDTENLVLVVLVPLGVALVCSLVMNLWLCVQEARRNGITSFLSPTACRRTCEGRRASLNPGDTLKEVWRRADESASNRRNWPSVLRLHRWGA